MPVGGGGLTTSPGAVTHKLEADFAGTAFGGSPTWTDITGWWMSGGSDPGGSPATMPWGRQDLSSTVESSTTSFVLNNADGRFTPGKALLVNASPNPYYPNVKRRVRMRETITDGTTMLTLADGYVDSWTVTVQTNGPTLATVSLSDTFARFSASTDTPGSASTALRSMVVEEMLLDSPAAFYPFDEATGSTSAGDISGNAASSATIRNSKYGAGTVTFGATLGFADGQTGVTLSGGVSSSASIGSWLEVPGTSLPTSAAFSIEIFFIGPSSASGTAVTLAMQYVSAGNVGLVINGVGVLAAFIPAPHGGASELDGTTNVCDGKLHHVVMTLTSDRKTLTLYLDGAVEATYTNVNTFDWTNSGQPFQLGMFYQLNPYQISWPFNGTYGPFAVYRTTLSASRVAAHHTAALTAFAGESTATRFARLLTYRPNLGGTTTGTMGTVGAGDLTGLSLGDALTDTATAEGGVIQTNRGTLTLIGRANWYDPATTLTLNAANGEVDLPTTWRDDTQGLVNDVTVSRPNGASQRQVNAASVTADGVAQASVTANLNSDRDAADMAGWLVAVGVQEQLDSPTLTVNLYVRASSVLTMAVCALKTYDVVTLVNLPASAPASTMSFQVQGGTYTVGADTFSVELYTTVMPPTTLRFDATATAFNHLDSGLVFAW